MQRLLPFPGRPPADDFRKGVGVCFETIKKVLIANSKWCKDYYRSQASPLLMTFGKGRRAPVVLFEGRSMFLICIFMPSVCLSCFFEFRHFFAKPGAIPRDCRPFRVAACFFLLSANGWFAYAYGFRHLRLCFFFFVYRKNCVSLHFG